MQAEGIWRWSSRLPPVDPGCRLTLGEGGTPLIRLKGARMWVKFEAVNPTGSFKDRGVAYLISRMVEEGVRRVVIDSSGNAAVSCAAYCARAGIELLAVMPGYSHGEKKAQVLWHGARIVETGDRESARVYSRRIAEEAGIRYIGIHKDPDAVPGFMTTAFELRDQIDADAIFVPTGGGTNLYGIGEGYRLLAKEGVRVPELHAVQSAACAPIAGEFTGYTPVEATLAEGVIVPVSDRKDAAVKAVRETGGTGWVVSDEEIYEALHLLADNGVYASPTAAVAVAGALQARMDREVVCVVTDTGLKSNLMLDAFRDRITRIPDEAALDRFIGAI